jgi:hypothetical protein
LQCWSGTWSGSSIIFTTTAQPAERAPSPTPLKWRHRTQAAAAGVSEKRDPRNEAACSREVPLEGAGSEPTQPGPPTVNPGGPTRSASDSDSPRLPNFKFVDPAVHWHSVAPWPPAGRKLAHDRTSAAEAAARPLWRGHGARLRLWPDTQCAQTQNFG